MHFVARAVIALVTAVLFLSQPAGALTSDAIQVFDHAQVLVPSPECGADPATISRLPAACFKPAQSLRPLQSTTYFHPATHWYRFTLPPNNSGQRWMFNVSTYVTSGDVYVVASDGRILQHQVFGSEVPVEKRPVFAHELIVPIDPPPKDATVVMRMTTPFERPTLLEVRTQSQYGLFTRNTMRDEAMPLAFLNGFAMAMGLFNLMLFAILRRRIYGLYAVAMISLVFYQVVETGAAWTMLWPNLGLRDDWPPYAAWVLYFTLIVAFTRQFLELPRVSKIADRVLLSVLAVLAVESLVYVLFPDALLAYGIFDWTDPLMTAVMLATMLGAGVVAWRAGVSAAPYYVLAFAGSAVGFVVGDAGTYDLYPASVTSAYISTSLGVAWESIFLALALGRRVREVEKSAARYEEYAYIDTLTSIHNRRGFDEAIDREWRRTLRTPGPISLIIFDIDHFKRYNDRFGHPAGDVRLIAVAQAIADAARRTGDFAARYGGEEFAMLLPGTPLEGAVALAESVRLAVRVEGEGESRLTISAGCACVTPNSDALDTSSPETLVAAADAALYIAKTTGRDRVCIPEPEIVS